MAVFPENMNKLDVTNTAGSLSIIENYIRYMTERMEFSTSNMTRTVSDAGVSTVEVMMMLQEVTGALSEVSSALNKMIGDITALNTRVTTLNNSVTEQNTKMKTIQNDLTNLTARVVALEGGMEG